MHLGGSAGDCRRFLRQPAFVVDTTESAESAMGFWDATVRWVIAQRTALTDEQCDLILSWALHEHTELGRRSGQPFSWKGRSLCAVLERSLDYQRQLALPWSCHVWPGHGWDWQPLDPGLENWSFVELTSGEALFREGQALRHCVASYAARCVADDSAIVSVRFKETRRITVEIAPAARQVVQARGMCNRPASSEEQKVIGIWLQSIVWREYNG
jgi:PcfJ-like protein